MAKKLLPCPVCLSTLTLVYKKGELNIINYRKNKEVIINARKS